LITERRLLASIERKSHFTIGAKIAGKNAEETAGSLMAVFRRRDPRLRRSTTFDNDTAFGPPCPARPNPPGRHLVLRYLVDRIKHIGVIC
jgi:hypothetical protein